MSAADDETATRVQADRKPDDVLDRAIRRGEADLVVAELPSLEYLKDLAITPLTSDGLRIACGAGHPLTRFKRVTMRRVLDCRWSMPPPPHTARRLLLTATFGHSVASKGC